MEQDNLQIFKDILADRYEISKYSEQEFVIFFEHMKNIHSYKIGYHVDTNLRSSIVDNSIDKEIKTTTDIKADFCVSSIIFYLNDDHDIYFHNKRVPVLSYEVKSQCLMTYADHVKVFYDPQVVSFFLSFSF